MWQPTTTPPTAEWKQNFHIKTLSFGVFRFYFFKCCDCGDHISHWNLVPRKSVQQFVPKEIFFSPTTIFSLTLKNYINFPLSSSFRAQNWDPENKQRTGSDSNKQESSLPDKAIKAEERKIKTVFSVTNKSQLNLIVMMALKQLGILLLVIVTSKYHVSTISIHSYLSRNVSRLHTWRHIEASVCLNTRENTKGGKKMKPFHRSTSRLYIITIADLPWWKVKWNKRVKRQNT